MPQKTTDRWFRVTAPRFDWVISPTKMRSFKQGQVAYGPAACIEAGKAAGAIEVIAKPKNASVGKDGQVIWNGN